MNRRPLLFLLFAASFPLISFDARTLTFTNPLEALKFFGEKSLKANREMIQIFEEINQSLDVLPEDYQTLLAQKHLHQQILKEIERSIELKNKGLKLADQNIALLRQSEKLQIEIFKLQKELLAIQKQSLKLSRDGVRKTRKLLEIGEESTRLAQESAKTSEEMVKALKEAFGLKL